MKNKTANQKGKELEGAVELIEKYILSHDTNLLKDEFKITPNKHVIINEIRHEIDLLVEIIRNKGYDSKFIFECKNWKKTIGKALMADFLEKLRDVNPQKGFYLARKFTKYAKKMAEKDSRIALITVDDNFNYQETFPSIYTILQETKRLEIKFYLSNSKIEDYKLSEDDDINYKGEKISYNGLIDEMANLIGSDRIKNEPLHTYPAGTYNYEHERKFVFADSELIINNIKPISVKVKSQFDIKLIKSEVSYKFRIPGRGKILSYEEILLPDQGKLKYTLISNDNGVSNMG